MQQPRKRSFLLAFAAAVLALTLVRLLFPQVDKSVDTAADSAEAAGTESADNGPSACRHRIMGVSNYQAEFPDSQNVQFAAACKCGVSPVKDRLDAEERKRELVYVAVSPNYHVDPLSSSIPYLVPRAALLLADIGQSFYDSLYAKGIPIHKPIVTSLLRTMDDVAKLQRRNGNATENSCHLYGTTFDICYNRYRPIGREVRNDTLKWVLSEVLRDKRREQRCYIKYEVKQGCFHITVR